MVNKSSNESLLQLFVTPSSLASRNDMQERVLAGLQNLISNNNVKTNAGYPLLLDAFTNSEIPKESTSVQHYLDQLLEHVVPHSINMSSPRCLGHMTSVIPEFVHRLDDVLVLLNQNLVKAEASRTFTLLERQTLGMIHRLIYGFSSQFYDEHIQNTESSLGIIATGGTLSNITALWIARNACFMPENGFGSVEEEGLEQTLENHGYKGAVVIGSSLMHYSIEKAAGLLGLGARNLIRLPLDQRNRIVITDLQQTIADCRSRGLRVIALVGIAGSTDCGSIDPLDEMADVAEEAGVHFHVDAAWGVPLLFSQRHRQKLKGIERADSVTVDCHKQMYLPMGSSILSLRNPRVAKVIEKQTGYILHKGAGDLGQRSLEGSRKGIALYIHAALNIITSEGYAFLIDENFRKAQFMADLVARAPEFELLVEPETNIVLYRYIPPACRRAAAQHKMSNEDNVWINSVNEQIQKQQYEAGRTYVSRTKLNGVCRHYSVPITALRAVVANPLTREEDIKMILEDQIALAAELEPFRISANGD